MQLRHDIKLIQFLQKVQKCQEDVLFCTDEGDTLNLSSGLSQMVFITISEKPEILYNARIVCKNDEDRELLKDYIM